MRQSLKGFFDPAEMDKLTRAYRRSSALCRYVDPETLALTVFDVVRREPRDEDAIVAEVQRIHRLHPVEIRLDFPNAVGACLQRERAKIHRR
jgi:hypothetical protein